jgi:hypothetical protein
MEATMSVKQSSKQSPSRAAKRARFSESTGRSTGASPLILVAGLIVALALIGGAVFALSGPLQAKTPDRTASGDADSYLATSDGVVVKAATTGHSPYPLVEAEGGAVRFPLTTFDDQQAHHYTYMHAGQPIEFFVLKSKDGIVRAAFNACDVCYDSKLGYTQDGDYMVCNNCGRRFPADQINVVHGGCNPSPLTRVVEGDSLVIEVEEIIKGKDYF